MASPGSASGLGPAQQPGHETNLVAAVIEFLVVDGLVFRGVRRAFNQED